MKFLSFIPLTLLPLAFANPTPVTDKAAATREFYLKSIDYPGNKTDKAGLYISTYHTGAGFNDVVLSPYTEYLPKFLLNETRIETLLSSPYLWGLNAIDDTNNAGWQPTSLNVGPGTSGFYFNNTDGTGAQGLKFNSAYPYGPPGPTNEFTSWLACDWFHGSPQLFWYLAVYGVKIPSSCALVQLERQYV
ncbi:hypothetical protein MMC25_000693 [Agyrium rufum]|nr:hypothetical protein [Agyrium rufum]